MDDFNFAFPVGECAKIESFARMSFGQGAIETIWPSGSTISQMKAATRYAIDEHRKRLLPAAPHRSAKG
jgi:hypothetical protein